ncbi:hypothetical protein [Nocardiopsis potens]|uniref:hypothetical protein n=1 Tax=Nocardiopsis potens TaxID=1246458 RepID=UPI0012681CD0|nr:hypothetical protein [Nocardiopsis potens]
MTESILLRSTGNDFCPEVTIEHWDSPTSFPKTNDKYSITFNFHLKESPLILTNLISFFEDTFDFTPGDYKISVTRTTREEIFTETPILQINSNTDKYILESPPEHWKIRMAKLE